MSAAHTHPDPFDADRHAIVRLLQSRDQPQAAAIVAVSTYRPRLVDNWNGGQYEAVIQVPPELYDAAHDEFTKSISNAAEAVIGTDRYQGLNLSVLVLPPNPDWVEEVVRSLRPRHVASERVVSQQAIDATTC